MIVPIIIQESHGIVRVHEPVTVGIPLRRGQVFDPDLLTVLDPDKKNIPMQAQPLAKWNDGSVKWVLLDLQVNMPAKQTCRFELCMDSSRVDIGEDQKGIQVQEGHDEWKIETGSARFFLSAKVFRPFSKVIVNHSSVLKDAGTSMILTDSAGQPHEATIDSMKIETKGFLRTTIRVQGHIGLRQSPSPLEFDARVTFYRNQSFAGITFTLRNPHPAAHPGGLWDLGDAGSIYFQDLSLHVRMGKSEGVKKGWKSQVDQSWQEGMGAQVVIYQDSSGGKNWKSSNHVNRHGKVMHTFSGYQVVQEGRCVHQGDRATPALFVQGKQGYVSGGIDKFWQNFPKAVEIDGHDLVLRLFPQQYNDLFELQGGEQKTHAMYLEFGVPRPDSGDIQGGNWMQQPLLARAPLEWYAETQAIPFLVPQGHRELESEYDRAMNQADELVEGIISGTNNFFSRREVIDEFGWRHFGDLYADHEAIHSTEDQPLVAHYNNQYDVVYGGIIQFLRTGNHNWFVLSRDLAKHVIDIDIYHTAGDRSAYRGGLFWHTDHYCDAATATHRAFSKANLGTRASHQYGGGPSNEHNFACGLLHYFYLTGDYSASESVKTLAEWVLAMDDGAESKLGWLDRRPTGQCSSTANRYYHGPGRGSAFSISTLLDAYQLTNDRKYIAKVEELLERCIHPHEDIDKRGLADIEAKWSYLVFLQVLGKFLFLKEETGEHDYFYHYARESLLHYAKWMIEHEVPYKQVLHKVCLPTETWPAQDIRKSFVFGIASRYASDTLGEKFNQKRRFFFGGMCSRSSFL